MIQHMNLVFRADGLNTGEFAFLMACCNHTDDRGYVIASMQQLADEAHMKMTAAKANKQRLIKRGLLASKERYSPKNNARIADLYRVNLKLLAEMKRERVDYGPSLVEELSFETPQETPSSDPQSDSDPTPRRNPTPPRRNPTPPPSESDGDAGSESDPLLLPSSSPSSLPGVPADADTSPGTGSEDEERETTETSPVADAGLPQQRAAQEQPAERVARLWSEQRTSHGLVTSPTAVNTMVRDAGWLLTQGVQLKRLEQEVAVMAAEPNWFSLVKHMERRPAQPAGSDVNGGQQATPEQVEELRAKLMRGAML